LADLFHDLTTGSGRGCLLVTCRPGETGLPGALRHELHGLARPDSLWLLHRILERDGLSLDDPRLTKEQLDPLLRDLADHPLSLELVGPHLRTLTPEAIRADFAKLLDQFQQTADEGRNRSLLASLEFSRRHLSPAARAALPWLGLFSGGVFEINLLNMSQIEPAAWDAIRGELQAIALLRVEDDLQIGNRPFLRFHPTLAIASADSHMAEQPETRQRFIGVYLAVMQMLARRCAARNRGPPWRSWTARRPTTAPPSAGPWPTGSFKPPRRWGTRSPDICKCPAACASAMPGSSGCGTR
jgi:hypothetical protein